MNPKILICNQTANLLQTRTFNADKNRTYIRMSVALRSTIKLPHLVYVGAIRTLSSKYQKFMTYLLVDNIEYRWQDLNLQSINYSVLSGTWLPIFSTPIYIARSKIRTYNLNIFSVPLYQVELFELQLWRHWDLNPKLRSASSLFYQLDYVPFYN